MEPRVAYLHEFVHEFLATTVMPGHSACHSLGGRMDASRTNVDCVAHPDLLAALVVNHLKVCLGNTQHFANCPRVVSRRRATCSAQEDFSQRLGLGLIRLLVEI